MRFLADENVPGAAVGMLRDRGHDVDWIRVSAPGAHDSALLAKAVIEGRILLTFDKDFGDIARSASAASGFGVALLRIAPAPGLAGATSIADLILSRTD